MQDTVRSHKSVTLLCDEEKELDPFLLGPWSKLTNSPADPITDDAVKNAVRKCVTSMHLSRLKFSRDVERTFPKNRKELVGDMVYFRTSKGIQLLDNRTDTMVLLPKIERATTEKGDVVWRLSNKGYKVLLRFTDTSKRGGKGGGWEYHARVLPIAAQRELAQRGLVDGAALQSETPSADELRNDYARATKKRKDDNYKTNKRKYNKIRLAIQQKRQKAHSKRNNAH